MTLYHVQKETGAGQLTKHSVEAVTYDNPGYEIAGWSTQQVWDGEEQTFFNVGDILYLDDNLELYAVWTSNIYTIEFNPNVKSGESVDGVEMSSLQCSFDTEYVLPTNTYVYKGYIFLGWSRSKNALTATWADGATIMNVVSGNETLTFYAVWKLCEHTELTYSYDGNVLERRCATCGTYYERAI